MQQLKYFKFKFPTLMDNVKLELQCIYTVGKMDKFWVKN